MSLHGEGRHCTGHWISERGIEVDKAKIETIEKLPPPFLVKGIRSFLGHAGFYRRFIKDFSKIAKPLLNLLVQGALFKFDDKCMQAFLVLKEKLVSEPIVVAPDWDLPFESDYVIGAVWVKRWKEHFRLSTMLVRL